MRSIISLFLSRRMIAVFLLGFSSGLPLLLIGSTLKVWMKEAQVDLTVIGLFALTGLPYSLKFLWAPLLDRYSPPFLDRRRGWILIFQLGLALILSMFALLDPAKNPETIAVCAFIVALFSASQDIAIDAYRRDILANEELGLGSSLAVNGYRLGMLLAGAGALPIADLWGWHTAYLVMAGAMIIAIGSTLFAAPVDAHIEPPRSLKVAVVEPFVEFFRRSGSLEILVFILLFKVGDQMASDMLSPFYVDLGFSKTEIGLISKFFGFWSTIVGGVVGGVVIVKLGLLRSLWIFGILQALSTFGFVVLARIGQSSDALASVIAFENLSSGMGTAAYVGFMASLCNKRFTATQYALLSSLMGVPRIFFGSASGAIAKHLGWDGYFIFCTLVAIPGLLMLLRAKRWEASETSL